MPHINLTSHALRRDEETISYKHEREHTPGSHETWDPDESEKTT